MRIQLINNIDEFRSLKKQWDRLFDTAVECYPTLTHFWLSAWWDEFSTENSSLCIIVVWQGDEILGAAPMMFESLYIYGRKRTVMSFLSNTWVDRINFLVSEPMDEVLGKIIDFIYNQASNWDILDLKPLDNSSIITQSLLNVLKKRKSVIGIESDCLSSPCLKLPPCWEDLYGSLSSSFRQSLRRKAKKLNKHGENSIRIITDESAIKPIMDISLESWQHENGTSMASQGAIRNFFEKVMIEASKENMLWVAILEVDDLPVAFEFNLLSRNILFNFKLGFKQDYSHLSPGLHLKAFVMESLFDDDKRKGEIDMYDFMGVNEPYKSKWASDIRVHDNIKVFNRRMNLIIIHFIIFTLKDKIRPYLLWSLKMKKFFYTLGKS